MKRIKKEKGYSCSQIAHMSGVPVGTVQKIFGGETSSPCYETLMVQPDVLILCDEKKIMKWGIMGAPDFVVEVISPSTKRKDCFKKLDRYAEVKLIC